MRQLIYVSAARLPFTQAQLVELLRRSRTKNEALGVTGLLLYHKGSFLQVLEGPPDAVGGLAKTIAADRRHDRFKAMFDRTVAVRSFTGWAMGFVNVTGDDLSHVAGRLDYLTGLNPADGLYDENLVRWVIDLFRGGKLRQAVETVSPLGVADGRPVPFPLGRPSGSMTA